MKKERIDSILFNGGYAESLLKAKAMVMAGIVLVDDKRVEKPSDIFSPQAEIRIKGDPIKNKYVGRGGLKL